MSVVFRRSPLLIVFCCMIATFYAQATVVTIGTGTLTQSKPIGADLGYERSASLYLSSEIGLFGNLSTLGWSSFVPRSSLIPTKIYLKTTSATSLTADTWANMISGATLVYDVSRPINVAGWYYVNNVDYSYSSGNLLVLCETNFGGTGPTTYPLFRYTAATSLHQAWGANTSPPLGLGTVNSNRPNIKLTFIPKTYPANPRHVAEWEPVEGALIRYPLNIPYTLVQDLSASDQLFCIVSSANQATAITEFTANGVNMANVQWIVAPSNSNWVRDYGPIFIFEDGPGGREQAIVDFFYNRFDRANDDAISPIIAAYLGIDCYTMDLTNSGGNVMTDGQGKEFQLNHVLAENPLLTQIQIDQMFSDYLGMTESNYFVDPTGTYIQHMDIWTQLVAVDKVMIRSVPISHPQYSAYQIARDHWASLTSSLGTPFTIYDIYTSNNENYLNSFIMNGKIFVPQLGTANDAAALAAYRLARPDFTVTGYLANPEFPWLETDAIHCRVNAIYAAEEDPPLPVELSSFSASMSVNNFVNLLWVTQTETGVLGYYVYRNTSDDFSTAELVSPMITATNTSQQQSYIYTDEEVSATGTYYYWLESADFDGSSSLFGSITIMVDLTNTNVGVIPGQQIRTGFNSIYPNPFTSTTTINYTVAKSGSDVRMSVFNLRGELVRELVSGTQGSSNYVVGWDGKDYTGRKCSNGIYLVVLKSGGDTHVRKAILVK